jgi:hypothetical protein
MKMRRKFGVGDIGQREVADAVENNSSLAPAASRRAFFLAGE